MLFRLPDRYLILVPNVLTCRRVVMLVEESFGLLVSHSVVDRELRYCWICEAGTRRIASNSSCSFHFR